ncbi:hypothetical protein BIV57_08040 [Mangrovactinospora gilvigrisea]|uniref:HTH luxR-type domain-containing protein n=1 Tax=Mangrovactinospora gilvigrisea TaxID=1428644 RepID=A0A1J7C903_9ACTN|nr:LuxR family transcriptional regulator [Mangrovactinospora gilvigrisea]OIV38016.1 hypothetical protein BIV57_08040 [Mangrovactinospora gilvigrisea]
MSPIFVGRKAEGRELDGRLAAVMDGAGARAVLVGGEAGVGKTRLLEEFLARAEERGAVQATGACIEFGVDGLPYVPLTTALRTLRERIGEEALDRAIGSPGLRRRLAVLLPELVTGDQGEGHDEESGEFAHAQVFEAARQLLENLTAERPLVLAVEDLHWSDRSTRDLLAYLLRALPSARLLLVATFRSDDLHRRHPLRPYLAELERLRSVTRVQLPRLTEAEVREQLSGILGREPEAGLVDAVFERSEGNAFFVEELAGADGLPDPLRDLLLLRVDPLPPEAAHVVGLAAEGGPAVEHALLAAVARGEHGDHGEPGASGPPDGGLDGALRAAVDAQVLVPDGERYRFRHALVREAVAADLLPGERARINRRFAEALDADPLAVAAELRTARLATYRYRARQPDLALPLVVRAAKEAGKRHAHAERLHMLERALELWDLTAEATRAELPAAAGLLEGWPRTEGPARRIDLLAQAVVAARYASRPERAMTCLQAIRAEPDAVEPPEREAWLLLQEGRAMSNLGRGRAGMHADEVLRLLADRPPSQIKAQVHTRAAMGAVVRGGDPERAVALAEQAGELARAVGSESQEVDADISLGVALATLRNEPRGVEVLRDASRRAAAEGFAELTVRAYLNLVSVLVYWGRWDEAVRMGDEGMAHAARFGVERGAGAFLAGNIAEALIELGRWDEAARMVDGHAVDSAWQSTRDFVELEWAELAALRGDREHARQHLERTRRTDARRADEAQYLVPRAWTEILVDPSPETVRRVLDEVRGMLRRPGTARYALPLVVEAARVLGAQAPEAAELREVVEAHDAQALPAVWKAWARLARAWLGDEAEWEPAEAALVAVGSPHYVMSLVRGRGAADGAEGGDEAPALTRREAEVLGLVAEGLSNRAVADRLFISPKTVSVHVSNVLAKLGASSRGEAVARARRAGLV